MWVLRIGPRLTLLVLASSLHACATIVSGVSESIRFESKPTGATVKVDGATYTTPADVTLSRRTNHDVEFSMPNYVLAKRQVLRDTNGWVFGNILIGSIIGLAVDYSTGASNNLEPDVMLVELVPEIPPVAPSAHPTAPPVTSQGSAAPAGSGDPPP